VVVLVIISLTDIPARAFVLQSSARVEIVPAVVIQRVGSALPAPASDRLLAVDVGDNALGLFVDGPTDRAVRIAWTYLTHGEIPTPSSASESRQDESGGFLLKFDDIRDVAVESQIDGYLLTLEYE